MLGNACFELMCFSLDNADLSQRAFISAKKNKNFRTKLLFFHVKHFILSGAATFILKNNKHLKSEFSTIDLLNTYRKVGVIHNLLINVRDLWITNK